MDKSATATVRAERRRALLTGKVASRDGSMVVDCVIRDLSEGGARISIPKSVIIPTRVYLVHGKSNSAYEAEITWIKAPQYGLKFLNVLPLASDLPPHLRFLKKLGG